MLDQLKSTYQGKKVFLTGHTGFKGSWMLLLLKELGATVKGYALAPKTDQDLYLLIQGDTLCESVIADIRDNERLSKEMAAFQPDFVFHMAAQALVIDSYENPVETYSINVMGTAHVLDALRFIDKMVHTVIITTDKVYENQERTTPYKEEDRLGGYDPYSNSKACTELVTDSFRLSFFNPANYEQHQKWVATARSGNVIGGGDWSENRIVPDIVRALQTDNPITVRNPAAVRPWQHVLEPIGGYLLLGAQLAKNGQIAADSFNFGPIPEDELTVRELVEIAIQSWGSGTFETPDIANKRHEAGLLKLDIQKAANVLGWVPQMNSGQAIDLTIDWYKTYAKDPQKVTLDQIKAYFNMA